MAHEYVQYDAEATYPGKLVQYDAEATYPGKFVQYDEESLRPGKYVRYDVESLNPGKYVRYDEESLNSGKRSLRLASAARYTMFKVLMVWLHPFLHHSKQNGARLA